MEGMTEENRALGTPLGKHPTRVLFLGSGELGKEVALELMSLAHGYARPIPMRRSGTTGGARIPCARHGQCRTVARIV